MANPEYIGFFIETIKFALGSSMFMTGGRSTEFCETNRALICETPMHRLQMMIPILECFEMFFT